MIRDGKMIGDGKRLVLPCHTPLPGIQYLLRDMGTREEYPLVGVTTYVDAFVVLEAVRAGKDVLPVPPRQGAVLRIIPRLPRAEKTRQTRQESRWQEDAQRREDIEAELSLMFPSYQPRLPYQPLEIGVWERVGQAINRLLCRRDLTILLIAAAGIALLLRRML